MYGRKKTYYKISKKLAKVYQKNKYNKLQSELHNPESLNKLYAKTLVTSRNYGTSQKKKKNGVMKNDLMLNVAKGRRKDYNSLVFKQAQKIQNFN